MGTHFELKAAWRDAHCMTKLRAQVDELWPNRKTGSDGTIGDAAHQGRDSDHNAWVRDGALGVVTAIDVTHDPNSGCDAERIVNSLVASRDARIKYIIWNRRIVSSTVSPWTWRPYNKKNPHTAHFHLSVSTDKALYDDDTAWSVAQN